MGSKTRTVALWLVIGTLTGSTFPELGNITAKIIGLGPDKAHFFNPFLCAAGLVGITWVSLALYSRYRKSSSLFWMVKKNDN